RGDLPSCVDAQDRSSPPGHMGKLRPLRIAVRRGGPASWLTGAEPGRARRLLPCAVDDLRSAEETGCHRRVGVAASASRRVGKFYRKHKGTEARALVS